MTKVWLLVALVLPCVVARPSDSGEQLRESRESPGFNRHQQDPPEGRLKQRIPVHIIFSDDVNRNQPSSESTTLPPQDQEQSTTSQSDITTPILDTSEVIKQSTVASESEKSETTLGDSNASIRHEPANFGIGIRHEQAEVKQISNSNIGRNVHVRVKSPVEIFKPQNKSRYKESTNKQQTIEDKDMSEEKTTTQNPDLFTNRQFTSPLDNPLLTFLTKQQALERDNTLQGNTLQNKPQQQNVRREIFQQQTIINPNPYMQQFLQQMQQANQPQQFTQSFTYQVPQFPQTITNFQQPQQALPSLNYPTFPDTNRAEFPQQFAGNPDKNGNLLTTLTLYPAIASVTYTVPGNQSPQNNPQISQPLPNTRFIQPMSRLSWPLADYFPIVIKDPFLSMYNMMSSVVEYGPEADVCKKSKNFRQGRSEPEYPEEDEAERVVVMENGGWRVLGKDEQAARKMPEEEQDRKKDDSSEIVMESGGNGNAGPYITRLLVRKGGVSIAGPGGIATAGSGGTAIVGPGGVAYTSPNGLAVVGPGGKVVGVPSGTDLSILASQVSNPAEPNKEGSTPRLLNIPPGGRVVATGPIVYYHQPE